MPNKDCWGVKKMNKIKIRLYNEETIEKFVKIASTFVSDVNVYDGSIVVDGKSVLGMYAIGCPKDVEVYINADSVEEERRFDSEMEKFR